MHLTLPIPGFGSVVSLAVFRLSGNGVQFAPGLPSSLVNLSPFLLGKLLIGDEFIHICNLLMVSEDIIARNLSGIIKDL